MPKLVDEVKIYVKAGDGGSGCASFRQEKYIPRGGPSGGDGGDGGNVYFQSSRLVTSLAHLTQKRHYYAEKGGNGRKKCLHGKKGKDLIVQVPIGTVLMDEEGKDILYDFSGEERLLIAEGGKGGRGNTRFATSTNQAPRKAEKGKEGQERWVRLVLKLVADVGIIGLPNSGKSTLLSAITSAKSKIANYPFTTQNPVLGMLELEDYRCFILADMPALVKGSHKGAGLGNGFLKHLERCKVLLYMIDATAGEEDQFITNLQQINNELHEANPELNKIPQIIVINKIDLIGSDDRLKIIENFLKEEGLSYCFISALKRVGLDEMLNSLVTELDKQNLAAQQDEKKLQPNQI